MALMAALLLQSCISNRKLAQRCADAFPVRDTIIYIDHYLSDTVYIPGFDQLDTLFVPCPPNEPDTLIKQVIRRVQAPGKIIRVQKIVRDTVKLDIDSAIRAANAELRVKLDELRAQNKIATAKLNESRRGRGVWFPWLLVGALVALILWLTFRKKKR